MRAKPIVAINPCKMEGDGQPTLTVGKAYHVIGGFWFDDKMFPVLDDEQEKHLFEFEDIGKFFDITIP